MNRRIQIGDIIKETVDLPDRSIQRVLHLLILEKLRNQYYKVLVLENGKFYEGSMFETDYCHHELVA
jgi:hypothetical protein